MTPQQYESRQISSVKSSFKKLSALSYQDKSVIGKLRDLQYKAEDKARCMDRAADMMQQAEAIKDEIKSRLGYQEVRSSVMSERYEQRQAQQKMYRQMCS